MKKIIVPILAFSAVLFSCKKEVITLDNNELYSSKTEYTNSNLKASGSSSSGNEWNEDDTIVITDPNNDADEDKRRKGK